jgi:hypothetical protein
MIDAPTSGPNQTNFSGMMVTNARRTAISVSVSSISGFGWIFSNLQFDHKLMFRFSQGIKIAHGKQLA